MSYPPLPNQSPFPPSAVSMPQPSAGFNMPQPGESAYPPPGGYSAPYPPPASSPGYPPSAGGYPPPQQQGYPGYPPAGQPGGYPPPAQGGGYPPPAQGGGYPAPPMGQVVTQQPTGTGGGENWMQAPQGPANCPPGLEYLTMIDQLLVHQKVELLEAMTGFETANKFSIKNSMGQKIYSAKESSGCLVRNCCGTNRPFDMKIYDNFGNMVIHLHRPFACQSCCCPCWLQSMEVTAPPGTLVGTVEQDWSIWTPHFSIKDAAGNVVLKIKGPFCTYSLCGDVEFKVLSADGEREVGMISKQWSGIAREAFTDADIFGISFPMDLDVRMKAVMLGACFLIDAMFFEKKGNKEGDGLGML
ncbi:Hypothetical predicted protein [Cloeon dipterum]|uniref:Phospholipid scramblase n=1 Tax=Cloeon dipterum TaxID=197152 RepID=A0A8S1DC87_9INSE|nr:Hypothetical predicted protein [Cloeon dipterum]